MKGFVLALLLVVAAVQGRSTGVQTTGSSRSVAALGDNPWLVHLRLAVATSGFLSSCAGSLISSSWVLSSANCLADSRFIWIRYGTVDVINPSLVTESSAVRYHPGFDPVTAANNVALISINRVVQTTSNIAPVPLSTSGEYPESANFCGYGAEEDGSPGEQLKCFDVTLETLGDLIVANSEDGALTQYDQGAPLVSNGEQIGFVASWAGPNDNIAGVFVSIAPFLSWIEEESGLSFN